MPQHRGRNEWIKARVGRIPLLSNILNMVLLLRYERRKARLRRIEAKVVARYGLQVQDGVFAGMRYLSEAMHSGFSPKILGCYEHEIAGSIAGCIRRGCPVDDPAHLNHMSIESAGLSSRVRDSMIRLGRAIGCWPNTESVLELEEIFAVGAAF